MQIKVKKTILTSVKLVLIISFYYYFFFLFPSFFELWQPHEGKPGPVRQIRRQHADQPERQSRRPVTVLVEGGGLLVRQGPGHHAVEKEVFDLLQFDNFGEHGDKFGLALVKIFPEHLEF